MDFEVAFDLAENPRGVEVKSRVRVQIVVAVAGDRNAQPAGGLAKPIVPGGIDDGSPGWNEIAVGEGA